MHSFVPVLEEWLKKLEPRRALEWGPGLSTEILLRGAEQVISVEHDPRYAARAEKRFGTHLNWELHAIDATRRDTHYATVAMQEADAHGKFELVFVDGRRRVECVLAGLECLNPGGVVLLHDWKRPNYQRLLRALPHAKIVEERLNTVVFQRREVAA